MRYSYCVLVIMLMAGYNLSFPVKNSPSSSPSEENTETYNEAYQFLRCKTCNDTDRENCPPLPEDDDCEPVRELNCGCCMMCAKRRGENCGVGKGRCKSDLTCGLPLSFFSADSQDSLYDVMVLGKMVCVTKEEDEERNAWVLDLLESGSSEEYADEQITDTTVSSFAEPSDQPVVPEIVSVQPTREIPSPQFLGEKGSCQKHFVAVTSHTLGHHEWVPSCENDDRYAPLQCDVTYGLSTRMCWCVNHQGVAVSGPVAENSRCLRQDNQ